MYILAGKQLINSRFVERFCLVEKNDAVLVVASYNDTRPAVTLSRYKNMHEATGILEELMYALSGGQTTFSMPDSSLFHEKIIKDARTKRKGGS